MVLNRSDQSNQADNPMAVKVRTQGRRTQVALNGNHLLILLDQKADEEGEER